MTVNERTQRTITEIDSYLGRGVFNDILNRKNGHLRFAMYINSTLMSADLADLDLSVRACNGLKRGGYSSIGDLVSRISGREDLYKIRNLGKKSVDEIMLALFIYQYEMLNPDKKAAYLNEFVNMNE